MAMVDDQDPTPKLQEHALVVAMEKIPAVSHAQQPTPHVTAVARQASNAYLQVS